MRPKSGKSWRRPARGLTLVEALVGSALLATLLVAMLVAKGQMAVQARTAENRIQACAILDGFLQAWWPKRSELPYNGSGEVQGHPGWQWRMRTVDNTEAAALRTTVVAVEILAPGRKDAVPAARVELLMPEDANGTQAGNNAH